MPPHRSPAPAAIVALLAGFACSSGRASAQCPPSIVSLYATEPVPHAEAAFDTANGSRRASYDLRAGRVFIHHPGTVGSMILEAVDCFRVDGPSPGAPVSMRAQLAIDGYTATGGCGGSGCRGEFVAAIVAGGVEQRASVVAYFIAETVPLVETLEIPLSVNVGESFEVHYRLEYRRSPGASHYGGGEALLRFGGLPEGLRVVSEQGYDSVVPVVRGSWGRLKHSYR